jgi:AcrR family transcriptional regulator
LIRAVPVVATSIREQIVLTAEHLFAERGVEGVSLRQIAIMAGSANNSVVQYHFGSKEQLVHAVFEFRLPRLHARRLLLIDERRPSDLRGWVECQLRAVLEQSELDGSHYMSFVATLYRHNQDLLVHVPDDVQAATREYLARLGSYLTHIIEPLRSRRVAQAMALIVHAAADRERARAQHKRVFPFAVELGDLLDGTVGFLEAPVSPSSLAALEDADMTGLSWPVYL